MATKVEKTIVRLLRQNEKFVFLSDPNRDLFYRRAYDPREKLFKVVRIRDFESFFVEGSSLVSTKHELYDL